MPDYKRVMTLLLEGNSYRQIETLLGCSHRTIGRAAKVLATQEWSTVEQVAALTADQIDELFVGSTT